jgi:glycine/D-amino acid oxidase-like deaminating enzyme
MTTADQPWLIVGQGLAGSCLAWEFHSRGVAFTIVDTGKGGSSRVAAGLLNPITGKNFEPSWRIEDFHPSAIAFFKKVELIAGEKLWHPLPILRLASSEKEWKKIEGKLDSPLVTPWLSPAKPETPEGFFSSIELYGGGWIDTLTFINATRSYFSKSIHATDHDLEKPCTKRIICTGARGLMVGQLGSHRCAKGEILTVRADWAETHIRIGVGGWLIPIGHGLFRVGSTYEWNQLDEKPSNAGQLRITQIAEKLGGSQFEITKHVAGIRPIVRRSQPLIGKLETGDWVFNGLGSKGTLYAPKVAGILADWILDDKRPEDIFILAPREAEI